MKTLTHEDYTVGWICALPIEMAAAKAMLNETHAKLPQSAQDPNTYSLGAIQGHNVVIACLPQEYTARPRPLSLPHTSLPPSPPSGLD